MNAVRDMATGSNSVVLGPPPLRVAEGRGAKDEMSDVDTDEEEAAGEARDVAMAKTETETASETATE
jgi:hypothetical protein